jgi:endonuclease YncB( thermonuclease family)
MIRRFFRKMGLVLLLCLLLALWVYPEKFGLSEPGRPAQSLDGSKITVKDGDTLRFGAQDYRLHGIDSPEFKQLCRDAKDAEWQCGKEAHLALSRLVKNRTISCEERAHDKFQRIVATCRDEQGRDLARAMIEQGLAVSFGGFAEGPYADDEHIAKQAKRGVWQGKFDTPSSWRKAHSGTPTAT